MIEFEINTNKKQIDFEVTQGIPKYVPANFQSKTVIPTTEQQIVRADIGYDGLEQVTVEKINLSNKTITENGTYNAKNENIDGYSSVEVNVQPTLQEKSVTITENGTTEVVADHGYDGLAKVSVEVKVQDNSLLNVIKGLNSYQTSNYPFELTADMFDENLTSISEKRFQYNMNITKLETPNNIKTIDNNAFEYCRSLRNVILSNVEKIGQRVFWGYAIDSITIGSALTSIGSYAFYTCMRVNFLGTLDQWVTITLSNEDSSPIRGAKDLYINDELVTEVDLRIATKINAYAFRTCKSITRVNAPLVTNIGSYAFKENYGLINVKLSSVTKMGYGAFYNCTKLAIVDFRGVTQVPTIQSNTDTFQNVPTTCKFIVPDELYDSWIASTNWVSLYNKGYQFIKASEYTEV